MITIYVYWCSRDFGSSYEKKIGFSDGQRAKQAILWTVSSNLIPPCQALSLSTKPFDVFYKILVLGLSHMCSVCCSSGGLSQLGRGAHITAIPTAPPACPALPPALARGCLPGTAQCVSADACLATACALWHCTGTVLPLRMCLGSEINSPQQREQSLNAISTLMTDFSSPAFGFSEPCLQVRFYSR